VIVFDTDVISFVLRPTPPVGLIRRVAELDPEEQATTAINAGELVSGAWRSPRTEHFLEALHERVWPNIRVLGFDLDSAMIFGRLRVDLEREGTPIAEPDLRIAAICLRHEDWLAEYR